MDHQASVKVFRLLENAISNHLEAPAWTKNDSVYVDFEYIDLDYFLLLEDYEVGSENSLFELLEYTRNANFVQIEQDNFVFDINYHSFDYENFSAQIELKNVLLMTDFNEDGTHESVLEKLDITGDGEYNVFKYGYVDPAGEISYHTIVYEAHPVQTQIDKKSETMSTKRFDLEQDHLGKAQRTMFVTTITNNIVEKNFYSVQEDVDLDGFMDRETSYEVIYNNIEIITYTKEVTEIEVNLEVDEFDEEKAQTETTFLEELRVSSFVSSKMSQTMTFSDIEWDEVVSTRVYEDAFPNELSEISNVENYLIPAISGSITSQTVDLSAMFKLSHSRDDVPAEFDKLTTIEDGEIVTENLLATTQSISIPGTYSINDQGFDSYSVEAIKSAPAEGTYWLNDLKSSSLSVVDQEGYYLYLDTSDDSVYETVIVMDKYDNIVGIGFDYDLDSRFHPGKTLSVEKSIIWSEKYGGDSITDDYIHFRETDKEVGVFNEPTFTDVLFDVGRMVFTQNNELMTLAEDMATNQFEEQINLVEDVFIQTIAGLVGYGAGILASYAGMFQLGYMLGYLAVMIPYQMVKILEQENYFAHRTFRSDDFADEKVLGEKFWFDDMYGDIMPITMFGSFGGVYAPVYGQTDKHSYSADVLVREFNFEESKASSLFTSYNYPKLDYWLSTRNVAGYSDFDESIVIGYLQSTGVVNPFIFGFGIPEYNHAKSSVYYLENQVQEETDDNDDAYLNTIVPTIDYDYANDRFSPRFGFVDSTGGFPAPEFYTEYPVIVSEDSSAVNQYCSIYKLVAIDDPEETTSIEIQLFDAGTKLEAGIVEIDAYVVWTQTIYSSSQSGSEMSIPITTTENSYINTMTAGEFEVDLSAGTVTISSGYALSTILNSYVTEAERLSGNFASVSYSRPKIIFQVKIEKYRSISDVRDLTQEQVNKIATAQAVEAAILEYNYQFNLATQTQLGFHEIIYTATVTLISTVLTMAATYAVGSLVNSLVNPAKIVSNKFIGRMLGTALQGATSFTTPIVARAVVKEIGQELLLDPWIESTVSGLVRRAGGNAIWQMVLSSIAESGREALSGPLTNIINPQQSQQSSFMSDIESDYFAKGKKPTVQDVLTAFNEDRTKIRNQQEQRKEQMRLLGGATRALSFVSLAIGFTASQFLGPVGALVYSTLAVYCFSEDISLKNVFNKEFNPIIKKISDSKVGNYYRDNKKETLTLLGIGVLSATMMTLQVLLPSLSFIWNQIPGIGAPITIGMVKKITHIKSLGTLDSLQSTLNKYFELNSFINVKKADLSTILKISTRLLSEHMTIINNNRKTLGYDPKVHKHISKFSVDLEKIKNVKVLHELIGSKGKQKYQWVGFIYEWVDTKTGITMTGKSRALHPERLNWYKKGIYNKDLHRYAKPHKYLVLSSLNNLGKSVFDKIVSKGIKIEGLIYLHLENSGLMPLKADGSIDFDNLDHEAINIAIKKRFKFTFKKLYFSDSALSKAEISRALEQKRKGVGLNRDFKSLGPISAHYYIPFIVKGISLGLSVDDIFLMLKKCKYKGTLKTIKAVIDNNFGSYSKARDKFYFPLLAEMHKLGFNRLDIGKIFVDDYLLPYLSLINDYFRQGYNIKKIASLTSLEFLIFDSYDIIKQVVFALYSDYYVEGMTFGDLRNKVFKDIFMEHIKLGVKDYTTLRSVLKGLDRPSLGGNIMKRNVYITGFFRRCFNGKGIEKVLIETFPLPETSELRRKAIDLIRRNKRNTKYSAAQLSIDLGFANLYKISIATLKARGPFYLRFYIGVTFENLKLEAFGLTNKNYFGMALNLIRDHIDALGGRGYNMGQLAIDLSLGQDFGYSDSTLRTSANRLLKKYTGYSWQELIVKARTNVLTK